METWEPLWLVWCLTVPAYVVVQIIVLLLSSGLLRGIAALPLVVMVPMYVLFAIGLSQGGDNNLAWLLPILSSPPALLYVVVVGFVLWQQGKCRLLLSNPNDLCGGREMETAKLLGGPVRFIGGLLAMLLASNVAAFIVGNALVMWNPNWGGKNLIAALWGVIAGPFIGLAGLSCFAIRRRDGMLFLGGMTVFVLWYPLIYSYLQAGPLLGGGL